jgi:hypothetical protein
VIIRAYCIDVVSLCSWKPELWGTSAVGVQHPDIPWLSLPGPRSVLQHDSIPIEILERPPTHIPIRIIRRDTLKSRCKHPSTTGFPLVLIGKVEDQEMILGGGSADLVSSVCGELQVVGMLGMSEDDTVKAIVVLKLGEHREVEPLGIHRRDDCQIVSWSSDAEDSTRFHRKVSSSEVTNMTIL